jgi:DNA-binding transcriptional LysR family regulator
MAGIGHCHQLRAGFGYDATWLTNNTRRPSGDAMKNLRQFDLNLLVALDALLTERNVTRAGERLHLSQSAMSGILSRLRHAFGDELLVRVGRHLEATDLAAELAGPVHECVQQIQELLDSRRPFAPETESRSFTIVASDYVAMLMLGPLMKRLTALAPGISARFVALEPTLGDRLAAGYVDFAIVPSDLAPGFPSIQLFQDTWTCAVSADHPSTGDRLTIDEFMALPHLAFNASDLEHTTLAEEYFTRMGYEARIVASTHSFATAVFSLHGTPLVAMVPKRLGMQLLQRAQIKLIEPPFAVPPFDEKLVWNPRFTASPAHAWLRAQLEEVAKLL